MAGWPTPWRCSALAFTLGMLLADGANGLWIAGLLRRADHRARIASRIMGLMVAAISFGVAGFGLARWLHADISPVVRRQGTAGRHRRHRRVTASFIVGNLAGTQRATGRRERRLTSSASVEFDQARGVFR
jgi:hypothetical protein